MLVLLFPVLIFIVLLATFCEQVRKSQIGKYIRRSHEMKNQVISLLSLGFHLQNGFQLHSNHISVYPTSEQPNTLDTYFSASVDSGNVVNEMRYEWLRLRSFSTFPLSFPISLSPIRLARSGFYFTGRNQECVCFSCGIHNSNWTGNNVTEIHRQLSPDCRHLQGRNDTNIPIRSRECCQSNELHSESNSCRGNNEPNSCRGNNDRVRDAQQRQSESHNTNSPNGTNRQNQASSNSQTNGLNDTLELLGVVIDRPRYPNYSVLATRISSYQQWPSHLTQTPRDLSTAGFFHVGYGDNVRCFFCGGGLRNWESGDDAWMEHARWFPKCPFLIQNPGQEFVTLVQSVQEEESEDIPPQEQTEHVIDIKQLPAAREIRQMGDTWGTIREAYQHLNRNRADVSTAEVIEEILTGEVPAPSSGPVVNDNQDIPPVTSVDPSSHNRNENNRAYTKMMDELGAMSLSEEIRSLREENRKLREERLCRICMEEDIAIAFLPCGHLCCCTHCAPMMRKCPICRAFIKGTVKTFPA